MHQRIYLDHAATTPLSEAARQAMTPWLNAGNASSLYQEGRQAKEAIDSAREAVSEALGCLFAEVIFTSGGTEAANLAIIGLALGNEDPARNRVLLGAAEHHCVLHTADVLRRLGYSVELVGVDREARLDMADLGRKLGPDVLLASVMHANNELGSINPIAEIADLVHGCGARLYVDAVQTFRRPDAIPLKWSVDDLRADLVSVSAHKVNGPKGTGALYVRAGTKIKALVGGGGQEREVRGGTENVAAIAGFGAAVRQQPASIDPEWCERLLTRLEGLGAVRTVVHGPFLSSHVHVRFPGIDASTLLIALDRVGISASSGAACSSGSIEPSHVLLACGYSHGEAREGIRLTMGAGTELCQLDEAAERIDGVLRRFRG
ncbi:cysteine desulfurase family protein [Fimbriimonas ginsengisoli]|uniref:Aminotransferase class V n=1 Tax=Fimbriimonas ginsengisoli Gsoil 348 TaxID=661478 RepID=A0A068NRA3_FIMGI|nr:cysteine desulfurase family protein [Fimbriimonas ginsengisoli]AIE84114.1 aminotransferase class V [Fimbriimonas ginsengisoli Gsoil 348]